MATDTVIDEVINNDIADTIDTDPRGDKRARQQIVKLKLEHPDLSLAAIGKIVDRNKSCVSRVLRRYNVNTKRLTGYKQYRADVLAGIQDNILSTIDADVIDKASLRDRIIATGVLYDKERLERNLSTANIALADIVERIDSEDLQANKDSKIISVNTVDIQVTAD